MKKVLVTGASGFIGYNIGLYFQEKGYDVIGWNRKVCESKFNIVDVDMSNIVELQMRLSEYNFDIIIHCAGSADVGKSVENPELDFESNVTLTHNLLFAMHKLGMYKTKFVFLSSAGVYGNPISLPITEDMSLNPLSPYAVHKIMCEELCRYFVNNYDMNIKIARIFSAYGTGLKKQIFWDMHKKSRKCSLPMFGTGNESRDYIHINDVVRSIYILATVDTKHIIFNIANGEEITIRKASEIFAKHVGLDKKKITFNGIVREGDPLNWKADISRITKLGYKKSVDMEDGLKEYIEWCKNVE